MDDSVIETNLPNSLPEALGLNNLKIPSKINDNTSEFFEGFQGSYPLKALRNGVEMDQHLLQLYSDTAVNFGALSDINILAPEGQNIEGSKSLFDGLNGMARDITKKVAFISNEELIKQNHVIDETTIITTANSDSLNSPADQFNSSSITRTASNLDTDDERLDIKRRNIDISFQHLEIENFALQKLKDIIEMKIKLSDEDAEYEAADVWLEWPNTSYTLSDTLLLEIEHLLLKLKGTSLVNELSYDLINRLQEVLKKAINNGYEIDISNSQATFESLKFSFNSLLASSVMLIIFNLQREEKKVYLDSYLTELLCFFYVYVEDFVLKEITSLSSNIDPGFFSALINTVIRIFGYFSEYIVSHQLNDTIVTKLEYLSIKVFFHPAERSYNSIKVACSSIITKIFQFKPDQREFIIDEVLSYFDKLPTHKVTSRQLKLQKGISIQFITALILNLIETSNLQFGQYSNALEVGSSEFTHSELEKRKKEEKRFRQYAEGVFKEKDKTLKYITSILVSRIINNLTIVTKLVFELFLQDLLNVISLPEWSSAEALLFEITKTLLTISEGQPSHIEIYLLEMVGLTGYKMIQLKGIEETTNRRSIDLTKEYGTVFNYIRLFNSTNFHENSSHFFMSRWVEELLKSNALEVNEDLNESEVKNPKCFIDILGAYYYGRPSHLVLKIDGDASTFEESVLHSYSALLLESDFVKLYQRFLSQLLKSMDHSKIKSRTRALKNLASLITKDSRLISIPQVRESLSKRIHDPSPLVKLAVLEIFDQYILRKPELIPEFYQSIILTLDKSTSIKIKSIKIAKRIFSETETLEIKVYCIEKILRRIEDEEESVVELSQLSLMELLFLKPAGSAVEKRGNVNVIVSLVSKSERNWSLFEIFLFDKILTVTDENKSHHENMMKACDNIIENIFQFVLLNMDSDLELQVEQNLGLLSIFSRAEHQFISQEQLLSLQPYIEADHSSSKNSAISFYALVILKNTLERTRSLRDSFLASAQLSLFKRLTKFNIKELDYAMPCIWILSVIRRDTTKLTNAALSCLERFRPFVDRALKNDMKEPIPVVQRLIYLIGAFGKYCDLEEHREVFKNSKILELKDNESVLSLMTKNILVLTRGNVNVQVRRAAVKNLVQICSTHPKLFMNESVLKVLDLEFESERFDFKDAIIKGLLEFLEREERSAKKRSGVGSKEAAKRSLDVDVFYGHSKTFENDGICASLVQRYIEPVLTMCLIDDYEISYVAVKYLKVVVKLGFANPRICTPTIIALQSSNIANVRAIGLELHKELHERHESLIDSSYIHGFKLATEYCNRLHPSTMFDKNQFLLKFYKNIEQSKVSKKKFLRQLIKSLSFDFQKIDYPQLREVYSYVLFLSANIAECEFVGNDEVYLILESIELSSSSQGVAVQGNVTEFINDPRTFTKEQIIRLGYLSAIILTQKRLSYHLRSEYKLPEDANKSELVSQKVKQREKQLFKVVTYDPIEVSPDAEIFSLLSSLQI
ncbi:hypothetical protein WICMUC_002457 [Wickerhamomyces mucosus]|uniref:Sister chromatid cohesion protein n=1 Tax=Wickerhamomyces mucosus TaxID=1378264 RepID=A0A9P8PPH8_9ASCO|nr:hypothetical protein WICMUC_002457 [Wickerhamomyces mucosus]